MFHAFFDLESEPDPHPKKMLLRPCFGAGGNFYAFVECWRNNFRTKFYHIQWLEYFRNRRFKYV